jgi:predicted transposase YbfD/YdcC
MNPNPQPFFEEVPDPRRTTRNKLHELPDIIMLTLCAVICGCEDWVAIEDFGHESETWLRKFLPLNNGIPSHDTISDVMGRIRSEPFAQAFARWAQHVLPELNAPHIAIDGKALHGSRNGEQGATHILSAYATQARWVLAAQAIPEKANEITAIPDLLKQLELRGALITIDAIGCQKNIAKAIIDNQGDYVLVLKDNHPTLHDDVTTWLQAENAQGHVRVHETLEKDHGRIETRRTVVSTELEWLGQRADWAGLKAVAMVEATRTIGSKTSTEQRYYLCSITDPTRIALAIREHWRIENAQHWVLDVQFGEDANRSRKDHSAANLGLIRRTGLNLLRQASDAKTTKMSLKRRKLRAMMVPSYREFVLFGTPNASVAT